MPFLKKFFFFAATFSLPAFLAYEITTPNQSRQPAQALHFSATEQQMMRPTCINQEHVRLNNLQNFIKKYSDLKNLELPANYEVHGIRFENEHPELVYRFMQLTTPDQTAWDINKDFAPATLKDKYARKLADKNCFKVLCAVEEIFGKKEGPIVLLILTEYDLNLSHFVWKNADPFRYDELQDILRAIEVVPNHLLPVGLNQKFIRFKRGYMRAESSEGVIANAAMEYFDNWTEESPGVRRYAIYHEFAHNWSQLHANNMDVSPKWLQVAGWSPKDPNVDPDYLFLEVDWTRHDPNKAISIYAKTNPFEDFAESVSAYRYAPRRLKEISPAKYNYVKNIVYGGLEFISACSTSEEAYDRYLPNFKKFEGLVTNVWIAKTSQKCFSENFKLIKNPRLLTGYLSCVNGKATAEALRAVPGVDIGDGNPLVIYNEIGTSRYRFKFIERQAVSEMQKLVLTFLKPHLQDINESIKTESCRYAYDLTALISQKEEFEENHLVHYAFTDLTERICESHIKMNLPQVTEESLRKVLFN